MARILILVLILFTGSAYTQDSLEFKKWQKLVDTATFIQIKRVKEIDFQIKQTFESWKYMSDPNGKFNATDVGGGPRTRLFFAVHSVDYWIVSYEHGGRGYHTHCYFITKEKNGELSVYESYKHFKSFELLKESFKKGEVPFKSWDGYRN